MTGKRSAKPRGRAPFPTREQVLEYIRDSGGPVGKREIARAFNLRGADRIRLRDLFKDMKKEGLLPRNRGHRPAGALPEVTVIEVSSITEDGDVMAAPIRWDGNGEPPPIRLLPERGRPPGVGDRVLARISRPGGGAWTARTMKRLDRAPGRVLGIFRADTGGGPYGGKLIATDRRFRHDIAIPRGMDNDARDGDLVDAEIVPGKPLGPRLARVAGNFGSASGPQSVSLICIHSHDLPHAFPKEALDEATALKPASGSGRQDLRRLPLVTIDGEDARDFDDAVWAERDTAQDNPGGWRLIVAIADVAWYVRPGRPLDREALNRGNSVYFPDRVVPMLPERLSNDLCSLRPNEDRACVAAHLAIDAGGKLIDYRFERALMRSAARLTYEQVQQARDGSPDTETAPLLEPVIEPLYGAWAALATARAARETLELQLPERQIRLDEAGQVTGIRTMLQYDSHRLIEDFMIAANVAAAEHLTQRNRPCMYRIHEPPTAEGLETLRMALDDLGVSMPARGLRPADLNRILAQTAGLPQGRTIHELVLRAQSQAAYSPRNYGHFGLALPRYTHFTSPIRRYADLLVHRAIVGGMADGIRDGLPAGAEGAMHDWGERISSTERRAMAAERDAMDRYMAAYLQDSIGAEFDAAVSGIARAGLFVTLLEIGASGLIPMSLLPDRCFRFDGRKRRSHRASGGLSVQIGDRVRVRLRDAVPVTGGLLFDLLDDGKEAKRRRR